MPVNSVSASVSRPPDGAAPGKQHKQVIQQKPSTSVVAANLQEIIETPTQTAQEARRGDHQAQRLLQKEAAVAAANNPTPVQKSGVVGSIIDTKA